jgi:hypothetical protein
VEASIRESTEVLNEFGEWPGKLTGGRDIEPFFRERK